MDDNKKEKCRPEETAADIEALTDVINLAPLGVLPKQTIAQLASLRCRLITPST